MMNDIPGLVHGYPTRLLVEEIILEMADIVMENRQLRAEVEELRECREEYRKYVAERAREAQESSALLLKQILDGCFNTAEDRRILDEHYAQKERTKTNEGVDDLEA